MEKQRRGWTSWIFTWAIPRPADVVAKLWFFVYGMLAALVFHGLVDAPLDLVNAWFHSSPRWSQQSVPMWAVGTFLLIGFLLEECLLQQAKLLWDDVRDRERDKRLLHNRKRPVARGALSVRQAIGNGLARLVIVVLFLLWQARGDLLVVFGGILFHQAVYQWAKPRGSRHPLRLLLWLSWNNTLRFVAGFVWVSGLHVTMAFLLIGVVCYGCSIGGLAAQWKMEAEEVGDIRPQSAWYREHGRFWQHVGLLTSILTAGVLSLCCGFWSSLMRLSWQPLPSFSPLEVSGLIPVALGVIGMIGGVSVFLGAGWLLISFLRTTSLSLLFFSWIEARKREALLLGGVALIVLSGLELASLLRVTLQPYASVLLVGMLLVGTIMYLFLCEGMSYTAFAQIGGMTHQGKEREGAV